MDISQGSAASIMISKFLTVPQREQKLGISNWQWASRDRFVDWLPLVLFHSAGSIKPGFMIHLIPSATAHVWIAFQKAICLIKPPKLGPNINLVACFFFFFCFLFLIWVSTFWSWSNTVEKQPNLIGAQFHLGPLASALVKLSAQFTLTHQFFEIYTPNVMAHMCWAAAHQAASSSMSNSVLHLQLQNLANLAQRFLFFFLHQHLWIHYLSTRVTWGEEIGRKETRHLKPSHVVLQKVLYNGFFK